MEARGRGGRCGGGLEDLLQPGQAEEVQGRHLYVGLVALGHVDGLPGLHQLLHDLQSVLTALGNPNILRVRSGEGEVHCVVVVTVTLHTEIHSHGGGDLHDMVGGGDVVAGDVNWPGAQALLGGAAPRSGLLELEEHLLLDGCDGRDRARTPRPVSRFPPVSRLTGAR